MGLEGHKGKYVFIGLGFGRLQYDAAVALDDETIRQYLEKRLREKQGYKRYTDYEEIKMERDRVLKVAREQGLKVYKSIQDFLINEDSGTYAQ